MSNAEQGSDYCAKHRYSIKQLLELSRPASNLFDLSKFSFDAARAGVIPPLGDCATNSRRTSAARSRIPSTETVSTLDGVMARRGGNIQEPAKQPHNPPEGVLAQQNAGFARFLKKHSSPTHQRVTAGGRIVPMESPSAAPPPFSLDTSKAEKQEEQRHQTRVNGVDVQETVANTSCLPHAQHRSIPSLRLQTVLPTYQSDSLHPSCKVLPDQQLRQQLTNLDIHSGTCSGSIADQYLPMYGTSNFNSFFPNFIPGQHAGCVPWRPSSIAQAISLPPSSTVWPYSDSLPQFWPQSSMNSQELITQQVNSARHSLEMWTNCYEGLDQQLKNLDRHRAMTNLNPDIASQRHTLVQHRSDTKDVIDNLREFLNGHEQLYPAVGQAYSALAFNIDAPVYVPKGDQTCMPTSDLISTGNTTKAPATKDIQKPRRSVPRRPIPIVPPPKLQTDLPPPPSGDKPSPDTPVARDGWGVKIGPAPPKLQQQQSEMAESLRSMLSRSSLSNQSRDSLRPAPEGGFFRQDTYGAVRDDDSSSDEDMAQEIRSIFAPPELESLRAHQLLDALQKPTGTSTRVKLPDGAHVDIQGQNLQSLPNSVTSVLENKSWSQGNLEPPAWQKNASSYGFGTPRPIRVAPTNHISSKPQAGTSAWDSSQGSGKENTLTSLHQKAAADASLGRLNDSQDQAELHSRPTQARVPRGYNKVGHSEGPQPWHEPMGAISGGMLQPRLQGMPLYEQLDANVRYTYFDRSAPGQYYNPESKQANELREWSSEGLTNKGYSLVSLQNVHAMAQVPQNLDGPTDSGSRGANSILSFVGKVRSPRLLRRTTTSGGA